MLGLIAVGVWVGTRPSTPEESSEALSDIEIESLLSKAEQAEGMQYDLSATSPQGEFEAEVWHDWGSQNMRIEGDFEGQESVVVITEDAQIVYLPVENMAVKVDKGQVEEYTENTAESQTQEVEANLPEIEIEGRESFDGKDCVVVSYPQQENDVRVWIWEEYGIPIKTETTGDEGETVVELTNLQVKEISADRFELPEGVGVQEVPSNLDFSDFDSDQVEEQVEEQVPEDMDFEEVPEEMPGL